MKNEELQQLVFDSLGACSWEYDLPTHRIVYSDEFFALLGYAPAEIDIDPAWVSENIHAEDLSQWRDAFVASIKGSSKYFDCELRFRRKSGSYVWLQTRGIVTQRDAAGRALRIVGMVFDISERKAAKESELRYRLMLDNIPDALSLKDRDGRYLYINRQFENWLGKPSYQICRQTAEEIFDPGTRTLDQQREHEREVWEQGKTLSMERQFPLTDDGQFRHAVITKFPVFDENGEILAIGTINTDVTQRFRAEEALRQSEKRYRLLFESAPAVLVESDWSRGKELIDRLRAEGVTDLHQYLIDHPQLIRRQDQVMRVLTVNQEALRIYRADSEQQLIEYAASELSDVQRMSLIEELCNFANGQRRSIVHGSNWRLDGESFPVVRVCEIYAADAEDWSQVLLSVRDISAEEAIRLSEQRYRRLFESAPAVLGEADWSNAKKLVADLREQGIEDIRQYLIDHPEVGTRRKDFMVIKDVNQEALRVFRADSKETMISFLNQPLESSVRLGIIEDLATFLGGERRSTLRTWVPTADGDKIPIVRVSEIYSTDAEDWSRVLISIRDISKEEAVRMSEIRFRRLFESAPAALYETDWSKGKQLVDELVASGVGHLRQYLIENPQLIRRHDDVHTILNVNDEALAMHRARDKESHIRFVEGELIEDQRLALIEVLSSFAEGRRRSQVRSRTLREDGEIFPVVRNCELISSDRDDWSLVLVSLQDLSVEEAAARQLEAYQQELRSLAGKISSAEESERRRISSALHDGTIQNLVLARIHLAKLKNSLQDDARQELADSINELLESSLDETRSLIFEISPPVLYELGLEPAVEWLAEHYKQRTGVEVTITSDYGDTNLGEEMNIVLFQTVRELLVNIAKHARAQKVSLDWCHLEDRIVLTVRDDGVGFDVDDPQIKLASEGGFGLFAVRERLKLMGADIEIDSSDQGTCVSVTAPAAARPASAAAG